MNAPKVTIGLTCYNAEATIARAVASALAQDWPDLEVLIVDDASDDNSVSIVGTTIAGDGRARLIRHETNKGAAAARNTVLKYAGGEFVAFFDDDDESTPERIATQLRAITAYAQKSGAKLVACFAGGGRRYPNGYVKPLPAIGSRGAVPFGAGVADWLLFFGRRPGWDFGSGVPSCALMARHETFAAVGGFDPGMRRVEDVDLAIRLALAGGHFIGTSEALFTQFATVAPDKSYERNLEAEQALAEKHAAYLHSVGMYHYARRWPRLRYWHFKRQYGRFLVDLAFLFARNPIAVFRHLMTTGPRRIVHERKMARVARQ